MKIRTYTIDGKYITIKDKDLYKLLWGKLRPLTEFRKWEEKVMSDPDIRWAVWTLDGGDNPRNAARYFSIEKAMELTEDPILKEKLWNLS